MERTHWLVAVLGIAGVVIVGAWIHGTLLLDTPDGFQETPPMASFNYSHDADNTTLAITHAGGSQFEQYNTQRLEVYVTESNDSNVTDGRPTKVVSIPFEIGETVLVSNVEHGDVVYLVWWNSDGPNGERAIMDKHTVGADGSR